MNTEEIRKIADEADMIIRGYAFTRKERFISVLNLAHPERAMLLTEDGKMIETNMDEIEQVIVKNIWEKDSKYMEDMYA